MLYIQSPYRSTTTVETDDIVDVLTQLFGSRFTYFSDNGIKAKWFRKTEDGMTSLVAIVYKRDGKTLLDLARNPYNLTLTVNEKEVKLNYYKDK